MQAEMSEEEVKRIRDAQEKERVGIFCKEISDFCDYYEQDIRDGNVHPKRTDDVVTMRRLSAGAYINFKHAEQTIRAAAKLIVPKSKKRGSQFQKGILAIIDKRAAHVEETLFESKVHTSIGFFKQQKELNSGISTLKEALPKTPVNPAPPVAAQTAVLGSTPTSTGKMEGDLPKSQEARKRASEEVVLNSDQSLSGSPIKHGSLKRNGQYPSIGGFIKPPQGKTVDDTPEDVAALIQSATTLRRTSSGGTIL